MKDLTAYVPVEYRRPEFKYHLTAKADAFIHDLAAEMEISPVEDLYSAVAVSASSFRTSAYFRNSKWFRDHPHHTFQAAKLTRDGREIPLMLVLSVKDGKIHSEAEVSLPDEYFDERVIEESKIEYTNLRS